MYRSNIVVGLIMFVIGGIISNMIPFWRLPFQRVENIIYQHLKPARTEHEPRVYVHDGGKLEHIPDFCSWTPQYNCAEINTPSGPIPLYIHSVSKNDRRSVSGVLLKTKIWEPRIMKVLLEELNKYPDAGFIDIGCNIGPFSLLAARMGRQVLSADAVIDNMLKLCKSVEKNNFTDQVVMVANPVFNEHVPVSLRSRRKTYEFTSIEKNSISEDVMKQEYVCATNGKSNTVLLDDMLPLITFKTAIMKIDVESFEFYVISGGINLFTEINIQAVIMEWRHVMWTDKAIELLGIMKKFNYLPYSVRFNQESKLLNLTDFITWTHDVLWKKQSSC